MLLKGRLNCANADFFQRIKKSASLTGKSEKIKQTVSSIVFDTGAIFWVSIDSYTLRWGYEISVTSSIFSQIRIDASVERKCG